MRKQIKKDKRGFTLIELAVVFVIIAILSALTIPIVTGYIDDANNQKFISMARSDYVALTIEIEKGRLADTLKLTDPIRPDSSTNHRLSLKTAIPPEKLRQLSGNENLEDYTVGYEKRYSDGRSCEPEETLCPILVYGFKLKEGGNFKYVAIVPNQRVEIITEEDYNNLNIYYYENFS